MLTKEKESTSNSLAEKKSNSGSKSEAIVGSLLAIATLLIPLTGYIALKNVDKFPLKLQNSLKNSAIAEGQPRGTLKIHGHARLGKVPIVMYHDILPKKLVFFDVTPEELTADFELIKSQGLTPITFDLLVNHLQTGNPLPEKPILLTFDDGYQGHYKYVYPLLKKYNYPAVFAIYTSKIGKKAGRSSVTWQQLQEMAKDPLVTIASHTINHPEDLRKLPDTKLSHEVVESKRLLEEKLGIPINYFAYPVGKYDARVKAWVDKSGYHAALTMDDSQGVFAGESEDLLSIGRFGQSRLAKVAPLAWGGYPKPRSYGEFNFSSPIAKQEYIVDNIPLTLVVGGKPQTIHAKSRGQVWEITKNTGAIAAVDGTFFSLKKLNSNTIIGPVLSQNHQQFIPGNRSENRKLKGRPLVLISRKEVRFIRFNPDRHNTLAGVSAELEGITDVFVGAGWLVKGGKARSLKTFGNLYSVNEERHRAFWGINQAGQPTIGVTTARAGAVNLGRALQKLGFRDAVMLDSGASTSLSYAGESLTKYTPRPVPHAVALFPPRSLD